MLNNTHFYHQLTRKAVILFGRLFDDILLIRKNSTTGKEIDRVRVPRSEEHTSELQSH